MNKIARIRASTRKEKEHQNILSSMCIYLSNCNIIYHKKTLTYLDYTMSEKKYEDINIIERAYSIQKIRISNFRSFEEVSISPHRPS